MFVKQALTNNFIFPVAYSELLSRQLSAVDPSSEVYEQCIAYTHLHSTMLAEVGLDFKEQLIPKQETTMT